MISNRSVKPRVASQVVALETLDLQFVYHVIYTADAPGGIAGQTSIFPASDITCQRYGSFADLNGDLIASQRRAVS